MRKMLGEVDVLLRGGLASKEELREGRVAGRTKTLLVAGALLGVIYGIFMGLHSVLRSENPTALQLFASAVKVPLLFLLTLAVTLPSLYVFSALAQSPLRFAQTARLLLMGIVVNLALLASFAPITGFFTLSTESYPFMVLLNVVFFAVAGFAGLVFIKKAVDVLFEPTGQDKVGGRNLSRPVLQVWVIIYCAVGAQMGWILRPFIGSPELPFSFFRTRDSSFFEAVLNTIRNLLV